LLRLPIALFGGCPARQHIAFVQPGNQIPIPAHGRAEGRMDRGGRLAAHRTAKVRTHWIHPSGRASEARGE